MWPTIININDFSVTWFGLVFLFGAFWLSFLMWRRMRSEYKEEEIPVLMAYLLLCGIGGGVMGYVLVFQKFGLVYWGGLVGVVTGLVWFTVKREWDFWEWLDHLMVVAMWLFFLGNLSWGWDRLLQAATVFLGLLMLGLVTKNYRKFRWYKSGKLGFIGLFSLIWISLSEIVVAIFKPSGLYWFELTLEQWVFAIILTVSLITLYLRSGRKLSQALIWINRRKRRV